MQRPPERRNRMSSQRLKRQQSRNDDSVPSKRRKGRGKAAAVVESSSDSEGGPSSLWTPGPLSDLKMSNIYNRSAPEAPAELFRKDLISAMKIPDSEPLAPDEYWTISDTWKQEWESGVQVPVNPNSLPEPAVTVVGHRLLSPRRSEFKLPKGKLVRITKNADFNPECHYLSNAPAEADRACFYDLDDVDDVWLKNLNGERALMGLWPIHEDQLERMMEELEVTCWKKIQSIVRSEEGLGIEFDENTICDVCRSPDSEEGNEMVFCDCCNICVHQACYGITTIPAGSWLCRTCSLTIRPECVLCPNRGGAMKCTRSGHKWAHVSCALWIPEVSIGSVERMEPITKISAIPLSRWALVCTLCREKVGACIQCSVKTCKTAYHVTCGFKHGLEMRAIVEDDADDGVKLRSYCSKHSKSGFVNKSKKNPVPPEVQENRKRKRKELSEEQIQAKAAKLIEIEATFDKHVNIKDVIIRHFDLDQEGITSIYNYWKLKRRAGGNRPLISPPSDDPDMLGKTPAQADQEKLRMFVQLRQDLERVRNLCYMVSRREKLSRGFLRAREQTFHKQVSVLSGGGAASLAKEEVISVLAANHGPSLYDILYSADQENRQPPPPLEQLLTRIVGPGGPSVVSRPPCKRPAARRQSSLSSFSSDSEVEPPNQEPLKAASSSSSLNSDTELVKLTKKTSTPAVKQPIYSDSSTDSEDEAAHTVRTKAAVKEFQAAAKKKATGGQGTKSLIVPQRQAAKKASESMKQTTVPRPQAASEPKEKEVKEVKEKENKKSVKKEEETFNGYVPQRAAAKKASESIKCEAKGPKEDLFATAIDQMDKSFLGQVKGKPKTGTVEKAAPVVPAKLSPKKGPQRKTEAAAGRKLKTSEERPQSPLKSSKSRVAAPSRPDVRDHSSSSSGSSSSAGSSSSSSGSDSSSESDSSESSSAASSPRAARTPQQPPPEPPAAPVKPQTPRPRELTPPVSPVKILSPKKEPSPPPPPVQAPPEVVVVPLPAPSPVRPQRSIFSPQHQLNELDDFEKEILAVDETHSKGLPFSASDDSARSFSFVNDVFFKEDTKEDSTRETLNLVEKLRLEYAKKSTEEVPEKPPSPLPPSPEPPPVEPVVVLPPAPPPPPPPPPKAPTPVPQLPELPAPEPPAQVAPQEPPPEMTPQNTTEFLSQKWSESEMIPHRRNSTSSTNESEGEDAEPSPSPVPPPSPPVVTLPPYPPTPDNPMYYYPTDRYPLYLPPFMPPGATLDQPPPPPPHSAAFTASQQNMAFMAALANMPLNNQPFLPPHQAAPTLEPPQPPPQQQPMQSLPQQQPMQSLPQQQSMQPLPQQQSMQSLPQQQPLQPQIPQQPPHQPLPQQQPPHQPLPQQQPAPQQQPLSQQPLQPISQQQQPLQPLPQQPRPQQRPKQQKQQHLQSLQQPSQQKNLQPLSQQQNVPPLSQQATPQQIPQQPLPVPMQEELPKQQDLFIPPAPAPKKMPQKPTRISARVVPPKPAPPTPSTPARSPRRRGGGRGRGSRGRPRNCARGFSAPNKFSGTVYDFDDEPDADADDAIEGLRAMRERRRSVDTHRFELETAAPPSPVPSPVPEPEPVVVEEEEEEVVAPLLPGPVDLRSYAQMETAAPTVEPVAPPPPEVVRTEETEGSQLKLKIKGPFLEQRVVAPLPAPAVASTGDVRRMRKKELLRQYWTEEPTTTPGFVAGAASPQRTTITIPKAVASMTSIPTREDYKQIVDQANMEKKKRKSEAEAAAASKKRGRPPRVEEPPPKLRIKLGPSAQEEERRLLRVRPPKKRLAAAAAPVPTLEELKKDSMKYRKQIAASFDKKSKKSKKPGPKLIIRLGPPGDEDPDPGGGGGPQPPPAVAAATAAAPPPPAAPGPDNNNLKPIRLKLSRNESGYVMAAHEAAAPAAPTPPPDAAPS